MQDNTNPLNRDNPLNEGGAGRKIGNGVIVAYAVLAAATLILAGVVEVIGGGLALATILLCFGAVFGGDLWIQHLDMESE